jgi:hypothetical protein
VKHDPAHRVGRHDPSRAVAGPLGGLAKVHRSARPDGGTAPDTG